MASPPIYWVSFEWENFSLESFISRIRLSTSILVTIILACTTDEPLNYCQLLHFLFLFSHNKTTFSNFEWYFFFSSGVPFPIIIISWVFVLFWKKLFSGHFFFYHFQWIHRFFARKYLMCHDVSCIPSTILGKLWLRKLYPWVILLLN